jgi:hypothetical protein
MALRTAIRGALMVSRRRSSLSRIQACLNKTVEYRKKEKPHRANRGGFVAA